MTSRHELDLLAEAASGTVECFECGEPHEATPSHVNQWSHDVIWAVVCPVDDLTDYYTREVVNVIEVDDPVPYLLRDLVRDESGSASARVVAFLCWALTWTMVAFLLLVWFAPRSDAMRIVPGSGVLVRDYCPNVEGTQTAQSLIRHEWRVKRPQHGPHAGETICKPRRHRGHK